ncbi:hypothetical protein CI109_103257 [Kwoniella shandongensis]|uniref:Uncharacterized protein n=1 Tax=Kwoniella shandongensis TaxID=1734106 RepID=A0A5M6BU67_9TREE|nr:uncharacterized protein CI109_006071 [Kwoniella shandongensis]KAA5525620.1 hypothetical protein CI109_006071 [Kwoniella shandongensis]
MSSSNPNLGYPTHSNGHVNGENNSGNLVYRGAQVNSGLPIDPSLLAQQQSISSQTPSQTLPSQLPPSYGQPYQFQSQPPQTYQTHPVAAIPARTQPSIENSQEKKRKSPKTAPVAINQKETKTVGGAKRGRPSKASKEAKELSAQSDSNTSYPPIMVYPPPPPHPGQRYEPSSLFSTPSSAETKLRDDSNLPSMGSWAPPSTASPRSAAVGAFQNQQHQMQLPYNGPEGWNPASETRPAINANQQWNNDSFESNQSSTMSRSMKRERASDDNASRALSDPEEVEASLALAELKRRDSAPSGKKVKKEEDVKPSAATANGGKKGDKDGRKSCAECRRLKAKCDRQFPCSNCRRRGCALVCPDGDLSCMQGKRLVLASTEQLHERIAQLESALFQSHSKTTTGHHPLLAPEYLDGGFASLPAPPRQSPMSHSPGSGSNLLQPEPQRSPKDASSASSIVIATPPTSVDRSSSQGRMAVESLLLTEDAAAPEGKREDEWAGENAAPAMIIGTVGNNSTEDLDERHQVFERLKKILRVLPSREETKRRADNFWRTSVWYQTVLRKDEFESVYEPAVYAPTPSNPLSPHKLAVVLMVLTLDSYLDLSAADENPVVAEYWDGVQRCFDTRFGWAASVAGVQALALATLFVGFGWRGTRASNFYWLRQMTSSALQIGLHKDPHPSLPEEEREFRRRVFHEIFVLDCLICLNHGQRTAINVEYIEAAYPKNVSQLAYKKYDFCRVVKSQVIDVGCLPDSAPASWDKVAQVKQILMQFDVSVIPIVHCPLLRGEPLPEPVTGFNDEDAQALQTTTTSMCHYKAMLYLFRPSLRRLIARIRTSPPGTIVLSDADRESVSMTYRACHAITLTSYYMARKHPRLMARAWMVWVQTFSAAVSMAALAIWCGPHLEATFVGSVYQELSEACDMISENGSKRSLGVLSLLPILKSLVSNRYPQVIGKDATETRISPEGEDMLFALLGGQVDGRDNNSLQVQQTQGQVQEQIQQQSQNQSNGQSMAIQINGGHGQNNSAQQNIEYQSIINPNGGPEAFAAAAAYSLPSNGQMSSQSWYIGDTANGLATQGGEMVLPLVQSAPTAIPIFPNGGAGHQTQQTQEIAPSTNGNGNVNGTSLEMIDNPTELWARLQTFYEPAPVYWGQSGVAVGGFVDYSGPMY